MPKGAKPGSLKARVAVYGYGFHSVPMQDQWAARGYLSLSISRHGLPQGREQAFYEEQRKGPYKGFGFRNNQNAENCDFNLMILRDLRAIEYLKSRPEWDGKTLQVNGGSMGAFQAINIAGQEPAVSSVSAAIPWCADLGGVTKGRFQGWRPGYTPALDYFDIVNQAKRIQCPVTFYIGLGDRVCPASSQFAMYNNMTCERKLTAEQSAKLLMPLDMAERLDWAGIMSIEPNGADMATVTVRYGSEHWLFCQVIAAGGAIRILDDPALSKRLCDMAKTLVCPL